MLEVDAPQFKIAGFSVAEDRRRGIRIRRSGGDVQGGDFHNEEGHRINWPVEYLAGDLYFDVPVYSRDFVYFFDHSGARVEMSYRSAYALPVDILSLYFSSNNYRRHGREPGELEILTFVRDIGAALRCMSEPNLQHARRHLGERVNFQIVHFETFPGDAVPLPIDWSCVGKAAIGALAASARAQPSSGMEERRG